jgi:hypothetical protein
MKPKMWSRKQNGCYCVTIHGKQIPFSNDKEKAEARYHQLFGARGFADVQRVDDLLDLYLDCAEVNRAENTYTAAQWVESDPRRGVYAARGPRLGHRPRRRGVPIASP